MASDVKCKTPDCVRIVDTVRGGARGLCSQCYSAFRRAVKRGEATWDEIEARKWCDPAALGGRKSKSPVSKRLEQLRGKE